MDDVIGDNVNLTAEKHVLSSLLGQEGFRLWTDISDILDASSFVADSHQNIYHVLNYVFKQHNDVKVDWPIFISSASAIGMKDWFDKKEERKILENLKKLHTEPSTVKSLAAKLRKLEIARIIRDQLQVCDQSLAKVNGEEKFADILGIVERPLYDFGQLIRGSEKHGPKLIFEDIDAYLDHLEAHPVKQVGITTRFKKWDSSIGGGLINGSVSVIGARIKQGKSFLADAIAYDIASQGINILLVDTEMVVEQHYNRMLAMCSQVLINDIKTGQYSFSQNKKDLVRNAGKLLKSLPYHYLNIAGQEFEETLGDMRRWIISKVGLNSNGQANRCVIILDYLKLMSSETVSKNIQEHMALGFQMITFVNFCIKYNIPGLTFLQLNRDGISSDSTASVAASDRLNWFCNNLTYFKPQSEEEIEHQKSLGIKQPYNKKLIPIFARDGGCLDDGDYINIGFNGALAQIVEGPTRFEMENQGRTDYNRPIVEENDEKIKF